MAETMQGSVSDQMATLSAIWESYAQLIRRRSDRHPEQKLLQRRQVLNQFLHHFINVSAEDKGNISIGEMRNVGNELSQEFLRNVDAITRHLGEEEATRALEDYMLRGSGWRLLYTIDRVGVKGVTQRHDLCQVLLNLLPYCSHLKPAGTGEPEGQLPNLSGRPLASTEGQTQGVQDSVQNADSKKFMDLIDETYNSTLPLSSCFQLVNKSSKLKPLGCPSLQSRKLRRVESNTSQMCSRKKEKKREGKARHGSQSKRKLTRSTPSKRILSIPKSDSDEEPTSTNLSDGGGSVGPNRHEERRAKQPRFKRGLRTHMWSAQARDEDSDTDDEYIGSVKEVLDSGGFITAYHLARIILRLLQTLGELDVGQNSAGRGLSASILPHLLYFLAQFRQPMPQQQPQQSREELSGISKAEKWLESQPLPTRDASNQHNAENVASTEEVMADREVDAENGLRSSFDEEEADTVPWQGVTRMVVLKQLVRALLTLSSIVATQQSGVRILNNLKVIESLLDINILDTLIPGPQNKGNHNVPTSSAPFAPGNGKLLDLSTNMEASVAMDSVCGVLQLLQAIYTSLPFNPSYISDANLLTVKLMRPDITLRIKRLMGYLEDRTHLLEKSPSSSELFDQEILSSVDSSRPTLHTGVDPEKKDFVPSPFSVDVGGEEVGYPKNDDEDRRTMEEQQVLSSMESSPQESGEFLGKVVDDPQSFPTDPGGTNKKSSAQGSGSVLASSVAFVLDLSTDFVRCFGSLITALKGVKVNYIHAVRCLKRRHRNCEYTSYFDHHHDILGVPHYSIDINQGYETEEDDVERSLSNTQSQRDDQPQAASRRSQSETPPPLKCVVSELATILLDSVSEAKYKASQIQLLSTLRLVGVCCCLQPERVVSAIVPQLPQFSPAVRSFALDTLTSILLDQFQGAQENNQNQHPKAAAGITTNTKGWEKGKESLPGESPPGPQTDSSRCAHCYLEGSNPLLAGFPTTLDSGFSSCDIEEIRRQRLLERWKSLRLLRKIIIARDENIALSCAKHLMTLAIRGNSEIKEELFFGVYLHVLHMKVRMPGHFPEYSRMVSEDASVILDRTEALLQEAKGGEGVEGSDKAGNMPELAPAMFDSMTMLNSQESLSDNVLVSGSLTPAEISSAEDTNGDGSVSSSVMLLCVSALPYVLQVDKVMSMFLARGGLSKLTGLLEYQQMRAPVMSVFEALVMIDERRLRGSSSSHHKSVYEGGGVIQTFIDTLAKRTCTVTATLQLISLQSSKDAQSKAGVSGTKNESSSDPAAHENQEGEAENKDSSKFISTSFAEQAKESYCPPTMLSSTNPAPLESRENLAHPIETDTFASQSSVSPNTEELRLKTGSDSSDLFQSPYCGMSESLPVLLDMWKTCAKLCMNSRMFRACYRESPCLYVVQETLILALSLLGELSDSTSSNPSPPENVESCSSNTASSGSSGNATSSSSNSNSNPSEPVATSPGKEGCSNQSSSSGGSSNKTPSDGAGGVTVREEASSAASFHHQAKLEFIEAVMMVCFSCHTIAPSQKRGQEEELWLRLSSALQSCIRLEASKLSAVFQMLLNVALPRCPSILEYSYAQVLSMLNIREREDIADEDEVRQLLQQGLEEEGDVVMTEQGYEGDTEYSIGFDWKTGLEYSLQQQSQVSPNANQCSSFPAVFRLFVELMVACHRIASRGVILHTVALRLLQTLRSSRRAVRAVCSENLLEVLVDGFQEVLVHCPANGKQSTLQEIILSLVQVIAQSEISAAELRQFLRLFQDNTETTNSLLSSLLAVVENSTVTPNFSAIFPVKTLMPLEATGRSDDSDESPDSPQEQAVWHHTAVEFEVPGIAWPPYPAGFTIALWMCLDQHHYSSGQSGNSSASWPKHAGKDRGGKPRSDSDNFEKFSTTPAQFPMSECLLVAAIGNKEKMFEVWIHPKTASLVCRLTTGLTEVMVLRDITIDHLIPPGEWHLLVISYMDVLDGSTFVGKLNVILDGWLKKELILDHPASLSRHLHPQRPFLCVGDARHGATKVHTGTWKLATLRVFRGTNLSDDFWFHLYCLGPNCEGLGKCDGGEQRASYTPSMLKHMVGVTHLSWDVLVGLSPLPDLDKARDSQVVVYRVSDPAVYSTFVMPLVLPMTAQDDLGLVPHAGLQSDLLTQKPRLLSCSMRGRVKVRENNSLEKAIEQAGGIGAFLFLVAKIYENSQRQSECKGASGSQAEMLQSKVTLLMFQLVHRFPSLALAFEDTNGYAMLAKVFTSSKSIVGYQLLKVLTDATTTDSVFKSIPGSPHPVLRNHPEGVIRDITLLTRLLLDWRVWNRAGEGVTGLLFGALESLVCPQHPHHNFNLRQMRAGGVIGKIFNIYLERIQEGQPSLSVPVSQSAAHVVKSLLGSPPDLHLLMAVMDFLLLVHPAPSGFISFTRGAFYFKLWWDGSKPRSVSMRDTKPRNPLKRAESERVSHNSPLSDIVEGYKDNIIPPCSAPPTSRQIFQAGADSSDSPGVSEDDDGEFQFPPLQVTNSITGLNVEERVKDAESEAQALNLSQSSQADDEATAAENAVYNVQDTTAVSISELTSSSEFEKRAADKDQLGLTEDFESELKNEPGRQSYEESERNDVFTEEVSTEGSSRPSPRKRLDFQSSNDSGSLLGKDDNSGKDRALQKQDDTYKKAGENRFEDTLKADIDEEEEGTMIEGSQRSVASPEAVEESAETMDDQDQGLMTLCVSLLEYMTHLILEFPESSLDSVFSKVVSPKSMLVLAKNPSADMRLAVMKLLGAYLSRAPATLVDAFIKLDGFYLLANQLRSFPVNTRHVEAAISIFLKQDFAFDENYMLGDLGELTAVQQVAPILLLSLLDGTAADVDLCRNTLMLLSQLLEATPTMSTLLLDLGLAESLCNLATSIQRRQALGGTSSEEEVTHSLLIDVQHTLCTTAVSELSWTGPSHYQNVEDLFTLLKALEDNEFGRQSAGSKKRADTARAFQISLVVKMFEYIEKRSEEFTQTAAQGWFTSSNSATSPSSKTRRPVSRGGVLSSHSFTMHSSSSTTSPASQRPLYLKQDQTFLPRSERGLPFRPTLMRRSTFSSPDMMGLLSEPGKDNSASTGDRQGDNESSGSNWVTSPHRSSSESGSRPSRLGSIFTRRHKMIYASVTQSDLLERFRKLLVVASDLAVMYPRDEMMRPVEQRTLNFFAEPKTPILEDRYLKHLFINVFRFYEYSLNKDVYNKKNRNPIMHGAKDVLRFQFTRLFLCMMSLKVDFDMRAYTLAFVMAEPRGTDAIKAAISDKQVGQELSFYLHNLLSCWKDWLNSAQRENGFSLMQILRRAGFSVNSPDKMLTQPQVNAQVDEKKQIDARYRKDLLLWLQKREAGTSRITQKFDGVLRRVTEQAMAVTQDMTRLQGEERHKLVTHLKQAMTAQIQLKKQWQTLVQDLTHERAVWYSPASYPQSWQLDPTEGPGRVRKRLQRCHLGIERRFLLDQHQLKLDAESVDPPLIFLFEDDHQMSDSAALIYRLYTNEKIQHTCRCTAVYPASESKGELLVGEVCIFFVADGAISGANYTQMLLGNLDQLSITWPHTDIRELHKRWYQLQDVGLEIFLISGRTCLLAFQSTNDRDELYTILRSSLELPNLIAGESLQSVQKAWLDGEVTNYDYLMHLNKLAGRSYTDLMQYPVFPFVLRDYHSNVLNLKDTSVYRNLKRPIAVQDRTREARYKDNYEFLCQEAREPDAENQMLQPTPFHYGSHYSNSGTVLHYLVRLPPFTRMFLSYQDRNFDIPDRTFHHLATSWRLSSYESSTDVKELIPEFFFLPEFFKNAEGFDFGYRQNGEPVDDVHLPPWAGGDPRLFVLIHRQALESEFVTFHLSNWIDLVFGYKQQGEEAVKAINVFHPSTYFGVDASTVKEPLKRQALLTMIRTYGQTPKQLFRTAPHPRCQLRFPSTDAHVRRPVPNVVGLRWGLYVGSPELPPPVCHSLMDVSPAVMAKLVALPTGLVFGVERNCSILLLHGKQRDMAVRSTDVMWAGVVTWGYHDEVIRIRSYRDKPLINFLPHHSFGKILCVESVPDCRLLFTAGTAGVINAYNMTHNSSKPSNLQVRGVRKTLYGHSGAVTCLYVCQAFSLLVSGSQDGTIILWDLNRLTYVRSISSHCTEVSTLTVSDTLGDIASVSYSGDKECSLQLHTVNAIHIASQTVSDLIHCLGYSCAPEGKAVNVVAGGLESGVIRLWSSWDLTPLRDLEMLNPRAVISLTFTSDSQYLMASLSDGRVVIWSREERLIRRQLDKFIPVINSADGEK
ncbi:lysosomal-trafficking regulator isoform X2 [Aplysia californica]|uniref:Lysosomal-trafficking regulator isoform X2 n=1 Tax=Aplysia californica TaxID=6500 RepID=A0ABM1W0C0_APLCA|nr:lysosomal-trafficking regulator isoform X2 [Aplysia californica]